MTTMTLGKPVEFGPLAVSFEIFRDRIGHWCARRGDGKVCGTFLEHDAAIRFARRECRDPSQLVLIDIVAK